MDRAIWRNARALLTLAVAVPAFCHEPVTTNLTWTREISRLVYTHCGDCHRPGGSSMSLLTYEETRPWAKAIRDEVLSRRMPPFDPVKGVGEFRDDRSLSPPEMELFVLWVEGGAPEGDPAQLQPAPRYRERAGSPPTGKSAPLIRSRVFDRPLTLYGIAANGALEISALLPDQSVERLLWINDFHPQWNRPYWFRRPLALPRGSRILLYSKSGATAKLLTEPPPAP